MLDAFRALGLPEVACAFLVKVWEAIQFLDDVKDGDAIADVDGGIYTLIVALPTDEFLCAHRAVLLGGLAAMYHKWQAANAVEAARDATQLDKAYVWRAGYYDLVLLVAALCLPRARVDELAASILSLYGETREDYLKEILHA